MRPAASEHAARQVLAHALAAPPRLGHTRLVCVDGPAGSGKTTLASMLAALRPGTPLVHMDDLYPGWTGLARAPALLHQMLEPLSAGQPGHYRHFDWVTGRFSHTVTVVPRPLVVVEGVGCGTGRVAPWINTLVWVEASHGLRVRRGLARDGDDFAPHWHSWAVQEHALFVSERTRERADLRIGTDGATIHAVAD